MYSERLINVIGINGGSVSDNNNNIRLTSEELIWDCT